MKYNPEYNQKEENLIKDITEAFGRKELDPNVPIANVIYKDGTYNYFSDPAELYEGVFRGVSFAMLYSWEEPKFDISHFFPGQYKPIPWWEFDRESLRHFPLDDLWWLSPYAKFYFFPMFLLACVHDMNVIRLKKDLGFLLVNNNVWNSLIPPDKLFGRNCWKEANSIPKQLKEPLNKDLYQMTDKEKFLAFISFFNEEQKGLMAEFVRYAGEINYPYELFPLKEDETVWDENLKACWSF